MRRYIKTDWERGIRDLIYLQAGIADDLHQIEVSAKAGSAQERPRPLDAVREDLANADEMLKQWHGIEPKGSHVVRARYFAYRISTSNLKQLLSLYCTLIPWITDNSSIHQTEAAEMATRLQQKYVLWFTLTKDIPVTGRSLVGTTIVMVTEMENKSGGVINDITTRIREWTPGGARID